MDTVTEHGSYEVHFGVKKSSSGGKQLDLVLKLSFGNQDVPRAVFTNVYGQFSRLLSGSAQSAGYADPQLQFSTRPVGGGAWRAIDLRWARIRQKEPRFGGWSLQITNRFKLSRAGQEAHEVLVIDRRDPEKTVKTHFVEEFAKGCWQPVHEEHEEWPAKTKRPRL